MFFNIFGSINKQLWEHYTSLTESTTLHLRRVLGTYRALHTERVCRQWSLHVRLLVLQGSQRLWWRTVRHWDHRWWNRWSVVGTVVDLGTTAGRVVFLSTMRRFATLLLHHHRLTRLPRSSVGTVVCWDTTVARVQRWWRRRWRWRSILRPSSLLDFRTT